MKLWMRKTLVVLFTIVTFGLVSPPAALMADKPSGQPSSLEQNDYTAFYDEHDLYDDESDDRRDPELLFQSYKEQLLDSAEDQSFLKFGSRIAPVIEDDYRKEILPKIENVISDYLATLQDDEAYQDVVISSMPSAGKTEKFSTFTIGQLEKIFSDSMCEETTRLMTATGLIFIIIQQKMDFNHIMSLGAFTGTATRLPTG